MKKGYKDMFKKLSNLLFEDVDEDTSDYAEEEQPVITERKRKPAPEPVRNEASPVFRQPEQKSAGWIDAAETAHQSAAEEKHEVPAFPAADQGSVFKTVEPVVEEPVRKPATLGITVDELSASKPAPAAKKPVAAQKAAKPAKKSNVYEFQPIISPIFGVDEKDMDAMQTGTKMRNSAKTGESVSSIISPFYGLDAPVKTEPIPVSASGSRSAYSEPIPTLRNEEEEERDDAEFSLDDILKVRDQEFGANAQPPVFNLNPEEEEELVDSARFSESNNEE